MLRVAESSELPQNRVTESAKTSSLLSGSAVYLISNILNAAIPFALLPVLTRYLGPTEYGQVAIFQTLLVAFGALMGLSVAGAANRKFYDGNGGDSEELSTFIGSCLQILLATSVVAFFLTFALRKELANWLGLDTKWVLGAVLGAAGTMVVQIRLGQWQVRKMAWRYGRMVFIKSLVNVLLTLLLVVGFSQEAEGRMAAQVWTMSVFAGVALILLNRDSLLKFSTWRPEQIREALRFGVPLIPHIAGGVLLIYVDRLIITSKLGLADAGIYLVAAQLAGGLALIFDAINKAYVPWLFERLRTDNQTEKLRIVRSTYAWFGCLIALAALAFAVGPWAVTLIAGERYARAGEVIGWLALGQCFGGAYTMVTNYIFFSKRTGLLSVVTISSGLFNVALLLGLVPLLGLHGASIAFCIAMATRFLFTWAVAHHRHPMPWFGRVHKQ